NFRRWLWCGGWMSACNGLTQSAQFFCIKDNLGISFATRQKLDASLKLGQWAIARPIGAAIDRWGAVNTLLVSQTVAASGLLFLAAGSTAGGWWWAIPAWICWTAFAGHNVGLPALTVNLASPGRTAAYVALYLAFADLCYALATLTGGALWDAFRNTTVDLGSLGEPSFLSVFLLAGWGLRMLVLLGLRRVVEPHRRDR
ncbi:MAG TPA: hypothetical protein VGE52_00685, partial [Pirellulales bacterium]